MRLDSQRAQSVTNWKQKETIAESMIPLIGRLHRDKRVLVSIYGRVAVNNSVIQLIKAHRYVRQAEGSELELEDTLAVLSLLDGLPLAPSRVDAGKLAFKYRQQMNAGNVSSLDEFLKDELSPALNDNDGSNASKDIVLFGFGRIGRLLARLLIERSGGDSLNLKAIVVRKGGDDDLVKRASLLRRDSVHGSFQGTITLDAENNAIIANGNYIQVIYADHPGVINYEDYGIRDALVIDNTGKWRDSDGLSQHLSSPGVSRVLLTAPGKGDIKNIVFGINHDLIEQSDNIISAASCTTNAITPVLKVMHEKFNLVNGHVETVHSYTNDQNLIDNYHKGHRRGRSAALNMVLTETGAAKAVAKALPELAGKLTANAIRVPTPNVSMAILSLNLGKQTTTQEVNDYLRHVALYSPLQSQIDYINSPEVVSSDFVGSRCAGIVDAEATIVSDSRVNLYVWYDNEFGYSCQVVRVAEYLLGINQLSYPFSESASNWHDYMSA